MAFGEILLAGYTAGSPERARWLHLARSGSQSQRAIWFILPAHGASYIINGDYKPQNRKSNSKPAENLTPKLQNSNQHSTFPWVSSNGH